MHDTKRDLHVTYCTNIHPSHGMADVTASLDRYAVPLKARLSPDAPFGVGLRLSGAESTELLKEDALARFKAFLDERGLYVFTMNGFPYGPFHATTVKEHVHAPDWRDEERVQYTLRLIRILAHLLPGGVEGGISTSPLSYKAWIDRHDAATWTRLTCNVARVVLALVQARREHGVFIHLDIEPEPDGLLERSDELAAFFERHLLHEGASWLASELGESLEQAREHMRDHVQVCFDTCHVAVAYEEPAEALAAYERAGMRIGKIQVSSALNIALPADPEARHDVRRALQPFAESTYLHQVSALDDTGRVTQYPDLPLALPQLLDPSVHEWRVHYHVPVFMREFGVIQSTQDAILRTFELLRQRPFTRHVEVETYTWDVLPPDLKLPLHGSIERELQWVRHVL